MWPRARLVLALRAAHPRRRRPRPRARAARPGPLRQPLRALRRAGRRRRSGRPRRGAGGGRARCARHPVRRAGASSAARCCDEPDAPPIDGRPARAWLRGSAGRAGRAARSVTLLPRTTAFGYFPHNLLGLSERLTDHLADAARRTLPRERLWQVRAREVVLATGAIERPLVFPGNDRPGHHAGRRRAHLAQPLRRAARARARWSSPPATSAYAAALDLQRPGSCHVACIADTRAARWRLARARARPASRCSPRPACSARRGAGA